MGNTRRRNLQQGQNLLFSHHVQLEKLRPHWIDNVVASKAAIGWTQKNCSCQTSLICASDDLIDRLVDVRSTIDGFVDFNITDSPLAVFGICGKQFAAIFV